MGWILLIVVIVCLVGFVRLGGTGGFQSGAKVLLFLVFVVFGGAAAGLLYFSFAYADKGAGVMMFFAVPLGLIAWIAFVFLKGDDTQASYTDLSFDHATTYTVEKLDAMRADFEEVIRYNTEQLKRFWLSPFKRKQYRDEISHAQFMLRYIAQQRDSAPRSRNGVQPAPPSGG